MKPPAHLALLLCIAGAAGCSSPTTPLEPHELDMAAQRVASLSAEAQLLARQLGLHSVTASFAWVHQQALGQEALKVAEQMAKPVPTQLRSAYEGIAAVNARLQGKLEQIAQAEADPARLERLEQDFQQLGEQAKALEKGL